MKDINVFKRLHRMLLKKKKKKKKKKQMYIIHYNLLTNY